MHLFFYILMFFIISWIVLFGLYFLPYLFLLFTRSQGKELKFRKIQLIAAPALYFLVLVAATVTFMNYGWAWCHHYSDEQIALMGPYSLIFWRYKTAGVLWIIFCVGLPVVSPVVIWQTINFFRREKTQPIREQSEKN